MSKKKLSLADVARLCLAIVRGGSGDFSGLAVEAVRLRKIIVAILGTLFGLVLFFILIITTPLQTLQVNLNDEKFKEQIDYAKNNQVLIETEKEKVWQEFLAWLASLTKEGEEPIKIDGRINYEEVLIIYQVFYVNVDTGEVDAEIINKIARMFVAKDGIFSTRIKDFDEVLAELKATSVQTDMAMMLFNCYNDSFTTEINLGEVDESTVGGWQGNGSLGWALPGYTKISSSYGYRTHPTKGTYKLHTGIDVPAPAGVAILAAEGGKVIQAKMAGDWGNCVIIDHGGGLTTLYAHQSKIGVKVGQAVSKGDVIGYVGTTGASTGNHLHFEVRINGKCTNPMSYLGK